VKFIQAGEIDLIELEPDQGMIQNLASQAGFDCNIEESERSLTLEAKPQKTKDPLVLFDAGDPANIGWFSRCQFYVDGLSGAVLQTPLTIANCRDMKGGLLQQVRIGIAKELPVTFKLPGDQTLNEQVVYALLYSLLVALRGTGVAICGHGTVSPLAGRTEKVGPQN
tara:strand:+ start:3380 stop:3880 length:501 start_codon:yes stop_codon:yes gene_type:complete